MDTTAGFVIPSAISPTPAALRLMRPNQDAHVAHSLAVLRNGATAAPHVLSDEESKAVAELYRVYAPMLRTVAGRIMRDGADGEDVVHDVFMRLTAIIGQYRGGGIGGWLKQVTARAALMRLRAARTRREERLDDAATGLAGVVDEQSANRFADRDAIQRAVGRLPQSLRGVVVLRVIHGCTHHEIARTLGITPAASEVRLCRAIKALREALRRDSSADGESLTLAHAS